MSQQQRKPISNTRIVVITSACARQHALGMVKGTSTLLRLRNACARSFNGLQLDATLCNQTARDLEKAAYSVSVRGIFSPQSIADLRSFVAGALAMADPHR